MKNVILILLEMNIHVHLTPYQVQDDRRPWIRKEEKIFTDLLRRLGSNITRHLHFDNQTANLMTHFEVLQAFCHHIHTQDHQQQQQQTQQMHLNTLTNTALTSSGNAQSNDQPLPVATDGK